MRQQFWPLNVWAVLVLLLFAAQSGHEVMAQYQGSASAIYTVANAVPGTPTINTATPAGNGQATVSFAAPAADGGSAITAYTVTSSPGGITARGVLSPITVTGLTNGTAYTFTVKATNALGTGAASAASNAVRLANYMVANTIPGAPAIGTATAGNARATVSFTAPAADGGSVITAYTITSSPGGITASGTASPISVTGLTNGTAYTFTVQATNAVGTGTASAASNAATPTAPMTIPGAPTGTPTLFCTFATSVNDCGFALEAANNSRATIVSGGRDGPTAVRLHTEPGDNYDMIRFGNTKERTDLGLTPATTGGNPGQEQWWNQSILFPDDWVPPTTGDIWYEVSDFHHMSGGTADQANFNLEARSDANGGLLMRVYGGEITATNKTPNESRVYIGPVVKNVWYDFVYHVKWSSGSDGFFAAWVNGVQVLDRHGPTLYIENGITYPVFLKLANYHPASTSPSSVIHDRVIRYDR